MNFSFFELRLPDDDPVYTLKKVMEELDFSGVLACYSDKGRTGYNSIMIYAVVTYANMRGVRAVYCIVGLCERDLAFIWPTKGQKPRRDAFYDFKGKKLTREVLGELNYQFLSRLKKEGLITLKEFLIDGTKIEANANRYTFVWRGSINYHLAGLPDTIDIASMRKQRIDTIRLKLLKIAARVVRSAEYKYFKLYSSCPYKKEFYETLENIRNLTPSWNSGY